MRLRWAGHLVRIRASRGACRILVKKPEGRTLLENRGVDGRIILKWILQKWNGRRGIDWSDFAQVRDGWWAVVNAVMNIRVP